jgi:hypothetical protein
MLLFRVQRNRPYEAEQFAPERGDDLALVLAACRECLVPVCVIDAASSMRFVSLRRLTTAISVFSAGTP